MTKSGYVLLEVIIASALSAMLATMLLSSLSMINKSVLSGYSMMMRDSRIMMFFKQFERDISGAVVPKIAKKEEQKKPISAVSSATPQSQKNSSQLIQLEPLEKFFYAKKTDNKGSELSFITCNPLPSFNQAKPRQARVTYVVQPQADKKNAWRLLRYESEDVAFKEEKKASDFFTLIDGIKELRIEFSATIKEEQKKGKKQATKEVVLNEWPTKEITQQGTTYLPEKITVQASFWDSNYKLVTDVTYIIPIAVPEQTPSSTQQQQSGSAGESKKSAPTTPGKGEVVQKVSAAQTPDSGAQGVAQLSKSGGNK